MPRQAPVIKPLEDRVFMGVGMVVLAVACFAVLDTLAKYLAISGIGAFQVTFMRYFVALILVLAVFAPRYGTELYYTRNLKLEIVRALVLLASTLFNFTAVRYLPLTVTGAIIFMVPLIVTALSVPILGEKVGLRRWIAILVGFAGALIIIRPGGSAFHWAMFLSMGAAITYATYHIFNRKLAGVDSLHTQQFYLCLVASICVLPLALTNWVWPQSVDIWIMLVGTAVMGFVGHLLLVGANRFAEASTLAPFAYPQIIFMSVLSWLVFSQPPDRSIFIGAPLVIGSGLYIWLRERRLALKTTALTKE